MLVNLKHHAYLLLAGQVGDLKDLKSGNEFIYYRHSIFGIEESRQLITVASLRSATGERRIFAIESDRYTTEAQNSLLKLLEEPPADTHFFIIHHRSADFLPTLLSRLQIIEGDRKKEPGELESLGRQFLTLTPSQRLGEIASLLEIKTTDWSAFWQGLEGELVKANLTGQPAQAANIKQELARAHKLLAIRGSSTKLILEHLALSLPVAK